ncbi:Protein of unknown function [Propionibacterium freudenreichii]|nr:Protein of unknown function [Propionibacterium freudenreichii]
MLKPRFFATPSPTPQ